MHLKRRLGLEQEFFVVQRDGEPAHSVDGMLEECRRLASKQDIDAECFGPEWVKNIFELATPPCGDSGELAETYIRNLQVAMAAAAEHDLRLYPLAVYPTHLIPTIRDELNYHVQVRTVGHERFLNAGRCTGTHLHLEVEHPSIDPQVGVSLNSTQGARDELLNVYNFATALDPALIALSRACPYFEGVATGIARRTACYRGSKDFGWEGVYTHLPEVGSLRPYANTIEELVALQFERHYGWLAALDQAEVERELYLGDGQGLLSSSWNPVRLNAHGTVELRNMDSNLPGVTLALVQLISHAHRRLIENQMHVRPVEGLETLEWSDGELRVPGFAYLSHELLFAAVSEGLRSERISRYTQSLLKFAYEGTTPADHWSAGLLPSITQGDEYQFGTTEQHLLERFPPSAEHLTHEEGLEIVRYACDRLEQEVSEFANLTQSQPVSST